ncbi:MAG: ribonuclease D [Gemmatimonadetes bacterium]|nr:ribonuclease D [Gemmatimonadota bacterium]
MKMVETAGGVGALAERLANARLVAVDTEAAGYHRYRDRICLLQLSTRSNTYLIDTLAVTDLHPLYPIFSDSGRELVFHDADYDLRLLDRDFGVVVRGLFDTRIAAQFLGESALGLANLAEKYLGIRLDKKHQRADWAQRPLPPELVAYAAEDTRYLPELRDRLRAELEARGRLHWADEEFRLQERVRWAPVEDAEAFRRLKGTRDLEPRQLAALRELYAWREQRAHERDVATFRVLPNGVVVELARRMPATRAELTGVPGLSETLATRYAAELLHALRRARELPAESLPVRARGRGRPPPDPEADAALERLRAARDRAAETLGLERGFLMPKQQLEELARRRPRTRAALLAIEGVRRWQVQAAGEELLEAIQG